MAWVAKPAGVNPIHELRWGWTLADLERCARIAASTTRWMVGDFADRYAEAYSAAAEALYTAEHPPRDHDLLHAADMAMSTWANRDHSFRGRPRSTGGGIAGTAPRFVAYWSLHARVTPSPEGRVVDRAALEQILPLLTPHQRAVLHALAAHGDHATAAQALGMTASNFSQHLSQARRRFLDWWHQGERPSRPWGTDRGVNGRGVMHTIRLRRKYRSTRGPAVVDACCPDQCDGCDGCDGPCHDPDETLADFIARATTGVAR